MDDRDGEFLVRLARRGITEYLDNKKVITAPKDLTDELKEKRGVFVTLNTYPENRLRGCIGVLEPHTGLADSVVNAGISSATGDPRFNPLSPQELAHITIEVTVLTPAEPVTAEDPRGYLEMIDIGRHGLIIEKGVNRGLLLPQVPVEQGWGVEEFLKGLCMKAGLSTHAWMDPDSRLFRFEGVIFSEDQPMGKVVRRGLEAGDQ